MYSSSDFVLEIGYETRTRTWIIDWICGNPATRAAYSGLNCMFHLPHQAVYAGAGRRLLDEEGRKSRATLGAARLI